MKCMVAYALPECSSATHFLCNVLRPSLEGDEEGEEPNKRRRSTSVLVLFSAPRSYMRLHVATCGYMWLHVATLRLGLALASLH
jgi:hypothetical protein